MTEPQNKQKFSFTTYNIKQKQNKIQIASRNDSSFSKIEWQTQYNVIKLID